MHSVDGSQPDGIAVPDPVHPDHCCCRCCDPHVGVFHIWKWWLFKAVRFLKLYSVHIELCFAVALDTDFALDPLNIP